MGSNKKILIGTIGYHLLGNHSIGPKLLSPLQAEPFPEHITVDELNWGPLAIVQRFEAETTPFDRVILLGAVERRGRKIGDITVYQWKGGLPDKAQIQACIGDAATGVISVENLLVIGEYFKIWREVTLIDVEPGKEVAGEDLTLEMQQKIPEILRLIKLLALGEPILPYRFKYLHGHLMFADVPC